MSAAGLDADDLAVELIGGGLIDELAAAARRHRVFITLSVGTAEDIDAGPADE
jgi:hypothetical protein